MNITYCRLNTEKVHRVLRPTFDICFDDALMLIWEPCRKHFIAFCRALHLYILINPYNLFVIKYNKSVMQCLPWLQKKTKRLKVLVGEISAERSREHNSPQVCTIQDHNYSIGAFGGVQILRNPLGITGLLHTLNSSKFWTMKSPILAQYLNRKLWKILSWSGKCS